MSAATSQPPQVNEMLVSSEVSVSESRSEERVEGLARKASPASQGRIMAPLSERGSAEKRAKVGGPRRCLLWHVFCPRLDVRFRVCGLSLMFMKAPFIDQSQSLFYPEKDDGDAWSLGRRCRSYLTLILFSPFPVRC